MNLLIKKACRIPFKKRLINAFFSFNDPPPKKKEKTIESTY